MRISVQMLAFQTESTLPKGMLKACVAQFYPHVDQITIVEGATRATDPKRFDGDATSFTHNGSSTDGTIECLLSLPDPDKKIEIVRSAGWWDGKTQMANESAKRATGDYIWEISSDEFYHSSDMVKIKTLLEERKPDAVHFYANHFIGNFNYIISRGSDHLWGNNESWMRIFRNEPGSRWISHEPSEFQTASGLICNKGNVITREETLAMGIRLFHYSYVERSQAEFKAKFYVRPEYTKMWDDFQFDKNTQWINGARGQEYVGSHPEAIQEFLTYKDGQYLWNSC